MRELKFRAFDGKSMRYDVTGFEHGKENEMAGVFLDGDYYVISGDINFDHDQFNPVAVVMQFTGLKDKNGKDIYEGDIVYLSGYGKYTCEFPFTELWEAYQENDIGEILGNIHENPELME